MTQVSIAFSGPESWLFYVVAKFGLRVCPVAVTHLEGIKGIGLCGSKLIRTCIQIIAILSDPANRRAIQAELHLAEEFYRDGRHDPPRTSVPEPVSWLDFLELDNIPDTWDRGLREFPFLSTCLLVGAGYDPSIGASYCVRTEPLGTLYRDDSLTYGMVVVDISDLEKIRYGIVGFIVNQMAEVNVRDDGDYDSVEDSPPEDDPVATVEEDRPRVPLSAESYFKKFHYYASNRPSVQERTLIGTLEEYQLVDVAALHYIWPADTIKLGSQTPMDADALLISHPPGQSRRGLGDQAVVSLIRSTQEQESFDMAIFDSVVLLPSFRSRLLRLLQELPDQLGPTRSAGQLLSLAYAGHEHLDWVAYKHLSVDGLTTALASEDLHDVKSLSIRINDNFCGGKIAQLVKLLPRLENLQELCMVQEPTRESDDAGSKIFTLLSSAAETDSKTRRLLQNARLTPTSAFSSSLRRAFWLPTTNYTPLVCAFPVQQMFVRHQLASNNKTKFWPNYYYLGDALLQPQRFAAGFLQFLRCLNTDEDLFSLASAPSTLENIDSGAAMSPIPPEAFAVPVRPLESRDYSFGALAECWSKARNLVPGGWTVLVSQEKHSTANVTSLWSGQLNNQGRTIRYAFVRARVPISVEDVSASEIRRMRLGPDEIEVSGLEDFLRHTVPNFDAALLELVKQRLEELVYDLEHNPGHYPEKIYGQAPLGPGMEWLSVLGHTEASDMLRDFLEDAAFVRRNLRLAMEDDPTDRNWYPELLKKGEDGKTESESRNGAVFEAQHAAYIAKRLA